MRDRPPNRLSGKPNRLSALAQIHRSSETVPLPAGPWIALPMVVAGDNAGLLDLVAFDRCQFLDVVEAVGEEGVDLVTVDLAGLDHDVVRHTQGNSRRRQQLTMSCGGSQSGLAQSSPTMASSAPMAAKRSRRDAWYRVGRWAWAPARRWSPQV